MAGVAFTDGPLIARLTLERPEALNALDEAMAESFAAAARRARRSRARVLILEGRGRSFCAGGDLDFIERNRRRPARALAARMRAFYGAFLSVRELPQIVLAKVQGAAYGAGLCLALAADLRAAADDARLSLNFARLGLNPGMAAWPLARAAVGEARARELLASARAFSGADLAAWGGALAFPAAALDAEVERLAAVIAANSGAALRAIKAETRIGEELAPFLAFESRAQARLFRGPDLAEGVAAARQRRAPRFA